MRTGYDEELHYTEINSSLGGIKKVLIYIHSRVQRLADINSRDN